MRTSATLRERPVCAGTVAATRPDAFAAALSATDLLRREASAATVPLAEVYLEGARGNLHHAREAMLHARAPVGTVAGVDAGRGGAATATAGTRLFAADLPDGWEDERSPPRADLGADLMRSAACREMACGWYLGGMLVAALADHAWLHLESGTSWSTDRAGALALAGALSDGRTVARFDHDDTLGALEERVVRALAALGWRRLRSPRWEP